MFFNNSAFCFYIPYAETLAVWLFSVCLLCCALFREEIAVLTTQVQVANKKYQELSQGQVKNTNVLSALPEVI